MRPLALALTLSFLLLTGPLAADCRFGGKSYSEGAERCGVDGGIQSCEDGHWHSTVRACSAKSAGRGKLRQAKLPKASRGAGKWSPN